LQTAFLVTVAAVVVGSFSFNGSDASGIVATVFCLLSAVLSVTIFGTEFNARTMGLLLTQPVSRQRLWLEKMAVLAVALILVWLCMLLSIYAIIKGEGKPGNFFELAGATFLPILIAFCSAPYFTLVCRNFIGGVAFTLIFPWALFLVLMFLAWLGAWMTSQPEPWFATAFEKHPDYFIPLLGLIYCAVMYRTGYRLFLNFQEAEVQARELSLPVALENPLASLVKKIVPGYTGPMASLIRKELQVQRPTFIVAGALAALIICSRIALMVHESEVMLGVTIAAIAVYMMCAPFIAGVVSMAEERNWGTVGWQLTFPISVWKQSLVKLVVTYLTAVFLGLVIPLIVILAKNSVTNLVHGDFATVLAVWLWGYLPVLSLVVFASSVSNNTMRATVVYFGLLIATCGVFGLAMLWVNLLVPDSIHHYPVLSGKLYLWSQAWNIPPIKFWVYMMLGVGSLTVALVALIDTMVLQNYRNQEINTRRLWIQSSVIAVAVGCSAAVLGAMVVFINSYGAVFNNR